MFSRVLLFDGIRETTRSRLHVAFLDPSQPRALHRLRYSLFDRYPATNDFAPAVLLVIALGASPRLNNLAAIAIAAHRENRVYVVVLVAGYVAEFFTSGSAGQFFMTLRAVNSTHEQFGLVARLQKGLSDWAASAGLPSISRAMSLASRPDYTVYGTDCKRVQRIFSDSRNANPVKTLRRTFSFVGRRPDRSWISSIRAGGPQHAAVEHPKRTRH